MRRILALLNLGQHIPRTYRPYVTLTVTTALYSTWADSVPTVLGFLAACSLPLLKWLNLLDRIREPLLRFLHRPIALTIAIYATIPVLLLLEYTIAVTDRTAAIVTVNGKSVNLEKYRTNGTYKTGISIFSGIVISYQNVILRERLPLFFVPCCTIELPPDAFTPPPNYDLIREDVAIEILRDLLGLSSEVTGSTLSKSPTETPGLFYQRKITLMDCVLKQLLSKTRTLNEDHAICQINIQAAEFESKLKEEFGQRWTSFLLGVRDFRDQDYGNARQRFYDAAQNEGDPNPSDALLTTAGRLADFRHKLQRGKVGDLQDEGDLRQEFRLAVDDKNEKIRQLAGWVYGAIFYYTDNASAARDALESASIVPPKTTPRFFHMRARNGICLASFFGDGIPGEYKSCTDKIIRDLNVSKPSHIAYFRAYESLAFMLVNQIGSAKMLIQDATNGLEDTENPEPDIVTLVRLVNAAVLDSNLIYSRVHTRFAVGSPVCLSDDVRSCNNLVEAYERACAALAAKGCRLGGLDNSSIGRGEMQRFVDLMTLRIATAKQLMTHKMPFYLLEFLALVILERAEEDFQMEGPKNDGIGSLRTTVHELVRQKVWPTASRLGFAKLIAKKFSSDPRSFVLFPKLSAPFDITLFSGPSVPNEAD